MSSDQNRYPDLPPLDGHTRDGASNSRQGDAQPQWNGSSGARQNWSQSQQFGIPEIPPGGWQGESREGPPSTRPWPPSPSNIPQQPSVPADNWPGDWPHEPSGYGTSREWSTSQHQSIMPAPHERMAVPGRQEETQRHAALPRGARTDDADRAQEAEDTADLWSDDAQLADTCGVEFDRVSREIDELRLLLKQADKDLETFNHRKVLSASTVREMEEHLELHSRHDIRETYLAASEAEMRAFMLSEQRDQMRAKLRVLTRYAQFLRKAMDTVSFPAHAGLSPRPDDTSSWQIAAGADWGRSASMTVPGSTMSGLPALPIPPQPEWPSLGGYTPQNPHATVSGVFAVPATAESTLARVIQAQEEIRQRVAQRLHDGPTQSLANVMLTAEICEKLVQSDPRHALNELANLKGVVNAALQETRKFIFELRPMTLDDLGLVATLRRYAGDVAARYKLQIPVSAPQGERRLAREIEVPAFRIAQEAIANAVEHSHASVIHLTIALRPDGLSLVIQDNGSGFEVEPALLRARAHQTTGIASMQERSELLGGWLRLESAPGRGTRVEVSVPLHIPPR